MGRLSRFLWRWTLSWLAAGRVARAAVADALEQSARAASEQSRREQEEQRHATTRQDLERANVRIAHLETENSTQKMAIDRMVQQHQTWMSLMEADVAVQKAKKVAAAENLKLED